jgi:hypothetical protein
MTIESYFRECARANGLEMERGEVLAKILTTNDDSGRHGVLIPIEAYSFFPHLEVPDPRTNATLKFDAYDAKLVGKKRLAWKYYQRYPEHRITRLNGGINETGRGRRLVVFLHGWTTEGVEFYLEDHAVEEAVGRFAFFVAAIFGVGVPSGPGSWVRTPLAAPAFAPDEALTEVLARFDEVREQDWITTLRAGPTGLGHTFENLMGVRENNLPDADLLGIELKCKLDRGNAGGWTNLFQQAPKWDQRMSAKERIRQVGSVRPDGTFACYSRVTVEANNLGLHLQVENPTGRVDVRRHIQPIGYWTREMLQGRLAEKHSRAIFVNARSRVSAGVTQYQYRELIYCERPSVDRFLDLVRSRAIAFEFTMTEKANGGVRNHGYPWRLGGLDFLSQLFAFQVRLRS